MSWMEKMILGGMLKMDKAGGEGGGGGDPAAAAKAAADAKEKEFSDLKESNAKLLARLDALEKKATPPADDPDLAAKAKAEADRKAKSGDDSKKLEAAIRFNLGAKDWVKTNQALLPKEVEGIFAEAEKEKYDSAIDKDSAIKSALVQTFFNVQANLDLLTPSQKSTIEDFLKLTKNGKHEKAQALYESIFEPTFEMLKRVRKAEQVRADGRRDGTDTDNAYKEKMIKVSRTHYMGEKENAGRN